MIRFYFQYHIEGKRNEKRKEVENVRASRGKKQETNFSFHKNRSITKENKIAIEKCSAGTLLTIDKLNYKIFYFIPLSSLPVFVKPFIVGLVWFGLLYGQYDRPYNWFILKPVMLDEGQFMQKCW